MNSFIPPGDGFGDLLTDFWMEQQEHAGSPRESSSAPPEASHTDRLLSFRTHQPSGIALLDAYGQPVEISLSTQLHGMFFLAESPWDAAGNAEEGTVGQPKELTCYRRNLFQVSGNVVIPNINSVIINSNQGQNNNNGLSMENEVDEGKRRQIQALEATISGVESVEGSTVKIIMVPWKSTGTASQVNDDPPNPNPTSRSAEKEPAPIFLNYTPNFYSNRGYQDDDTEPASYPLNWKRLQFRSATANNGRRKDLQQHFLVKISIIATLFPENGSNGVGDRVTICESYSGAIIVRGRSPRNFSSRNDIPISGSVAASSRQNTSAGTSTPSNTSGGPVKKIRHQSSGSIPIFDHDIDRKPSLQQLQHDSGFNIPHSQPQEYLQNSVDSNMVLNTNLGYSPNLWPSENTWIDMSSSNTPSLLSHQLPSQHDANYLVPDLSFSQFSDVGLSPQISVTGIDYAPSLSTSPLPQARHQMTSQPHQIQTQQTSIPSIPSSSSSTQQQQAHVSQPPPLKHKPKSAPASSITKMASPSMDLLYEYFPIGVDDWLPPVDVVYRPHAAHHTTTVLAKGPTRSKRLFSETPFE